MKSIHVIISGLVQGVGFRAWLQREARGANVHGWVKNAESGRVEALLSGDRGAVKQLIERCEVGPPGAKVTDVTTKRAREPDTPGFRIIAV